MFSITNPMHADIFPSVRKMEGEVVSMTASMLGGTRGSPLCAACPVGPCSAALTSGLLWVQACRRGLPPLPPNRITLPTLSPPRKRRRPLWRP